MHISDGFLSVFWSIFWAVLYIPVLIIGIRSTAKKTQDNARLKMILAMSGAFCFVLSALKLPSVVGSSSHPTGVGLGTILFGPFTMAFLGFIVLIFQALLLAHGGITTLGANAFSMAFAGPLVGFGIFQVLNKLKAPKWLSIFTCAFIADLFTYVVTSFQLALSNYGGSVTFLSSLGKFLTVFALTQIPLAVVEGIVTVFVYNTIYTYARSEITELTALTLGGR
jgi:cobalt/nickel transport system permease protein